MSSVATTSQIDPISMIQPRRKITGMSAILLPFKANGEVAWGDFEAHVGRTLAAGLIPAVNMDTGYAHLIDEPTREEVLQRTRQLAADGDFVAGAFVKDEQGAPLNLEAYFQAIDQIAAHQGIPVIFQSFGLTGQEEVGIVDVYQRIGEHAEKFIAFELGTMFAPFGRIYSLETYAKLMAIPNCLGAKHSSLSRELEWRRLQLRDRQRPDFKVLTGNDLAIDMVMYGSDYLLGLSTFAPDLFAERDQYWADGDPRFYELNDWLQYIGHFSFRPPVPAYKHSAAQFLHLRGWLETNKTHPDSPERPESDIAVWREVVERLGIGHN